MKKHLLVGFLLGLFLLPTVARALTAVGTYNDIADRTLEINTIQVDLTITNPTHLVEVYNQPLQAKKEFNQNDIFIVLDLDHFFGDPDQSHIRPLTPPPDWNAGYVISSTPWPNSVQWLATKNNASTIGLFSFEIDVAKNLSVLPNSLPWAVHASLAGPYGVAETTDSGWLAMSGGAPPDPSIPSPEPATFIFLTTGVVGWAIRQRNTTRPFNSK